MHWSIARLICLYICWLMVGWLVRWLVSRSVGWSVNGLINWLICLYISGLIIDWSVDWLIDWLIDWVIGYCVCSARCMMTLNHLKDNIGHDAGKDKLCRHQDQYDNLFYLCKVFTLTWITNENFHCRLYCWRRKVLLMYKTCRID